MTQTCSHPINARTLTGVFLVYKLVDTNYQDVQMWYCIYLIKHPKSLYVGKPTIDSKIKV